jgi:hypothetical protein
LLVYAETLPFFIRYNITSYTPTKVRYQDDLYTIFGIPVLEYKEDILSQVDMLYRKGLEYVRERKMLTNKVAFTFSKTKGLLTTAHLSQSPLNDIDDNELTLPIKLSIDVVVHSNQAAYTIAQQIISAIKERYKPDFTFELIRSELIQYLREKFDFIRDIDVHLIDKNGNRISKDLSIHYTPDSIPKNEILTFVPEVISIGDIEVNVTYV